MGVIRLKPKTGFELGPPTWEVDHKLTELSLPFMNNNLNLSPNFPQVISQEHVSAEIWKKYLASWLGGRIRDVSPNQQARYFFQISAWTLFLALSHTFHCFQTHSVGYISKL